MIATTLATLRKKAGLSQQNVADKLGVARATYTNLENGNKSPTIDQVVELADLFEMSPTALITGNIDSDEANRQVKVELASDDGAIEPREVINEDPEVLREVLLYVLDKVGAKPNIGQTVLYKLLYFIDFDYYEKTGKSITGLQYARNHFGPTPNVTFKSVEEEMQARDELDIVETKYFNHRQKKYLPVVEPELKHLNAEQLKHIDEELARLSEKSASELSNLSHRDMPWLATTENELIDYRLAKYRTTETSVKESEDEL